MPLTAFTNTFAGNPLDRASDKRGDVQWLGEQLGHPESLAICLWNGQPLIEKGGVEGGKDEPRVAYVRASLAGELSGNGERLLFLGLWKDTAVFAVDLDGGADPADGGPLDGMGKFVDLRGIATALPAADAAIIATAKGMFEWRRRHKYCANCGHPSHPAEGGWKRVCESCNGEHFPRTDPVVIMLPAKGEKCLLGRQAIWPKGMYSALAGFLEPGESIEEACARELKEEAGLSTASVRYHSTQPWPYPSSLMIGLIAEVENDDATPSDTELEAVKWFTRDEAKALLAGELPGLFCPPKLAIAHQLLKAWAEEG